MNNRIDAIYARQSVDKKDSISIESQIEFCKYELKGGNCKEYTDKGYSGKNTDRPKFQELVRDIKRGLIEQGCDLVIKEVKSGYAASYQLEKKTIMNWVFRKSGVLARIYGDNAGKYEDTLASLPADMQKKMTASRDCKRLIDPNACSDTCVKGFVYTLNGDTHKKCRNDGMFFLLTNETAEYIAGLVCAEVTARKSAS